METRHHILCKREIEIWTLFGDLQYLWIREYKLTGSGRKVIYEKVKCFCGKEYFCQRQHLLWGTTKNCGCRKIEKCRIQGKKSTSHGMEWTPFYSVFSSMKARCHCINNNSFYRYGGRGIKCLWKNFIDFQNDMYEGYISFKELHPWVTPSIERNDNDGNYCKDNCTWIAFSKQQKNTSLVKRITFQWETKIRADWEHEYLKNHNAKKGILGDRMRRWWSFEEAFLTPNLR